MMELVRMVVVLSVITGVAGLALSGLKAWTDPIIEEQVLTFVQGPALETLFADAENNPIAERATLSVGEDAGEVIVFPIKRGGQLAAVAVEANGKGYGGAVNVMVGFNVNNDTLEGISITTHKETPGLGSRIEEPGFTRQFVGRDMEVALKAQDGDIDAIAGATMSSVGAVEAVQNAAEHYQALKDEIAKTF